MNYERVREQLKRLDTCRHGTVTANEIRLIVEDLINYTLKPDEYYQFLKQIPMDENGRVKYKQFLNQLLDRTLLVQEQQLKSSRSPQYEFTQPINPKDKLNTQQLREMLKSLIRSRYKDIENEFKRLDRGSYGELTPDLLYELFKRFVICQLRQIVIVELFVVVVVV